MSGFRNTIKGGWHPEGKDGGKESWRGDFKGVNQIVSSLPLKRSLADFRLGPEAIVANPCFLLVWMDGKGERRGI